MNTPNSLQRRGADAHVQPWTRKARTQQTPTPLFRAGSLVLFYLIYF